MTHFFDPAWESVLPEIASEEELALANSFLSISSFGSTAVGFALAGAVLAGPVNIELPFYIDSSTFAFSFRSRPPCPDPGATGIDRGDECRGGDQQPPRRNTDVVADPGLRSIVLASLPGVAARRPATPTDQ